MPFLSIIVPVYNKVNYVDECVSSILDQTYSDFELILVDDGSTDGSGQKCDHYGQTDPRVVVIHQDNMGVSAARNRGLSVSKGKFIGFADSDDALEKDMYELLINNAINSGSDISVCGIKRIYRDHVDERTSDGSVKLYDKYEGVYEVLTGLFYMNVGNKIFKSEIARNILFEGRFKEDLLYNVKAFLKADKSVFQDASKYIYKLRENSVSIRKFSILDMEGLMIDRQVIDLVSGADEKTVREAQINYFVQIISTLNLILLYSNPPYPDFYYSMIRDLREYSFLTGRSYELRLKHRIAYTLIMFSPLIYKYFLKLYVLLIPSEVGIRDK